MRSFLPNLTFSRSAATSKSSGSEQRQPRGSQDVFGSKVSYPVLSRRAFTS